MATFLFDKIVFGPVASRRLGVSLGINLLPTEKKSCNFNCVYCECGLTETSTGAWPALPVRSEVRERLERVLSEMRDAGKSIDAITFAGNGEPTLHPEFRGIVSDTRDLRDRYFPDAVLTVLTNATRLQDPRVVEALRLVEKPVLKLDAGRESTFRAINNPVGPVSLEETIGRIQAFSPAPMIQSMFVRFGAGQQRIDNTTEEELVVWLAVLKRLNPSVVMVYSTARDTALAHVERVSTEELGRIADRVRALGFHAEVY